MSIAIYDHEIPDLTHDHYDITFFDDTISTIVTDTPAYVDDWIALTERIHRRRLHCLIVGLDVEWRPNTRRNMENPVATLQLCVGHRCLVFQILYCPRNRIPLSLINFLRNPSYTFTGVGIREDVQKLEEDHGLVVASYADLRPLAVEEYDAWELHNAGLKGLARWVLGKEIHKPKRITMSRWDKEWLSPAQVQYACIDAFLSFEMGRILISQN